MITNISLLEFDVDQKDVCDNPCCMLMFLGMVTMAHNEDICAYDMCISGIHTCYEEEIYLELVSSVIINYFL